MRKQLSIQRTQAWLLAISLLSTGCGGGMHRLQEHTFPSVVETRNQGYYHCPDCGRVVVKGHHCQQCVSLPCYGFQSTCWRPWPNECERCPPPDAVAPSMVGEERVPVGPIYQPQQPAPAESLPTLPAPTDEPKPAAPAPPVEDNSQRRPMKSPAVRQPVKIPIVDRVAAAPVLPAVVPPVAEVVIAHPVKPKPAAKIVEDIVAPPESYSPPSPAEIVETPIAEESAEVPATQPIPEKETVAREPERATPVTPKAEEFAAEEVAPKVEPKVEVVAKPEPTPAKVREPEVIQVEKQPLRAAARPRTVEHAIVAKAAPAAKPVVTPKTVRSLPSVARIQPDAPESDKLLNTSPIRAESEEPESSDVQAADAKESQPLIRKAVLIKLVEPPTKLR